MNKKIISLCLAALMLTMSITAFAAEPQGSEAAPGVSVSYPTAVTRSEDGREIRKMYDLSPTDDPAGIPRSDFEQDGFRYTPEELLKQELPEREERQHTETVKLSSKSKDMADILPLLPQEREVVTEDGLSGTLALRLESIRVEIAGYGSSTTELTAQRTYPGLASQDTSPIPKAIEEDGHTLTLQAIHWQQTDGPEAQYTATATYTGTASGRYVKGYTVTADYAGTVSRINLNRTRYVAIFKGEVIAPVPSPEPDTSPAPDPAPDAPPPFNWAVVLIPAGIVVLAGAGVGVGLFLKKRNENEAEEVEEE